MTALGFKQKVEQIRADVFINVFKHFLPRIFIFQRFFHFFVKHFYIYDFHNPA